MKQLKRTLALLLSAALILAFTACSKQEGPKVNEEYEEVLTEALTELETAIEDFEQVEQAVSEPVEEPVQAETAPVEETTSGTKAWKEFLVEYEEWVDAYIVLAQKVKDNPLDMTALTDYSAMMTELAQWSSDAEALEEDLTTEEALEYSAELARIAAKLAAAAY